MFYICIYIFILNTDSSTSVFILLALNLLQCILRCVHCFRILYKLAVWNSLHIRCQKSFLGRHLSRVWIRACIVLMKLAFIENMLNRFDFSAYFPCFVSQVSFMTQRDGSQMLAVQCLRSRSL